MTQPLICHFLIGLPASGKSTLALELQEIIPNAAVVSTDSARKELFGDEETQGDWSKVESEVLEQIKNEIALNKPVIYDATNVRRDWRMGMLMKIEEKLQVIDAPQVYWVAWHLQTPVDVCKEWNKDEMRDRQVPDDVIEEYSEWLNQFNPHKGEGFIQVAEVSTKNNYSTYEVKIENKKINLKQAISLTENLTNKANRKNKYIWHQYSKLLDFERLMHLISTVVRYPGIGYLYQTQPKVLQDILELKGLPKFTCAAEEIIAVIKKEYGLLYANQQAIEQDLSWLEDNGLIGNKLIDAEIKIEVLDNSSISEEHHLFTHRYSNLETFSRLIKVIRFISYYPFLCIDGKTATLKTKYIGKHPDTVRHTALVEGLIDKKILSKEAVDFDERKSLENLIREDLRQIKPYRIIHDPFCTTVYSKVTRKFAMNKGYFIGTGILSKDELNEVFNLLRSQAEEKYFNDPLAQNTYQNLKEKMKEAKLWHEAEPYPAKIIGSKSVVDFNQNKVNRERFKTFEKAIINKERINLEIIRQPWDPENKTQYILVYPLQIVFHLFAWYLGYEVAEGKNKGLLYFERIDRLRVDSNQGSRTEEAQLKALHKLNTLYQASAGIYLGNSVEDQKNYLDPRTRKSVTETLRIYATENSFKFLSETTQRFSENQMKMTLPEWLKGQAYNKKIYSLNTQPKHQPHIYRIDIALPKWFINDIYLIKWLVPWGDEVKVTQPKELIEKIQHRGSGIVNLYQ